MKKLENCRDASTAEGIIYPWNTHSAVGARRISYPSETPDNGERLLAEVLNGG